VCANARLGVLCIVLCLALGIANIFNVSLVIIFSILCIVQGVMLIFVEIPLLLRICPTSEKFDLFIRRFAHNWPRAGMYIMYVPPPLVANIRMAAIQFCSTIFKATSLIAAGVFLLLAGLCYGIAALKKQEFTGSKALGGQGIA